MNLILGVRRVSFHLRFAITLAWDLKTAQSGDKSDARYTSVRSRAAVTPEDIKRLLGSELAQDDPNFLKYSVPRTGLLRRLASFENRLIIINAARGSGKSGLLISHKHEIGRSYPRDVIIHKFYSDIALPPDSTDVSQYVSFWKNTLLGWVVDEIGRRTTFAFTDSQIEAVESAEKHGVKERNPVTSLLSRLKFKHLPVEKLAYDPSVTDGLFSRLSTDSNRRFWILLDEMDDHYTEARNNCLVGLMQAAKHLTHSHQGIGIRLTIRPHIMTLLRTTHDIIQKFRSDELSISWNETQLEDLLARRISVFEGMDEDRQLVLGLVDPYAAPKHQLPRELISRYFEDFDASFGAGKTSNFRALYTLSFYRPRWMIEYCTLALEQAEGNRATKTDFKLALEQFGTNRVQYLCAEHNYHIPQIEAIINQIIGARKAALGRSEQLMDLLLERVIQPGIITISGDSGKTQAEIEAKQKLVALDLAKQLFAIEFIRARQSAGGRDDHRFYRYQDRPSLLASWSSEPNITWQLHPTFSRGLNIEDSGVYRVEGEVREFGKRGRDRRKRLE
jgi:hypothetical protein